MNKLPEVRVFRPGDFARSVTDGTAPQPSDAALRMLPPYPRPIREVHIIELTTRCNLRCRYCPSPQKLRPHEDMAWDTFEQTLRFIGKLCAAGTQGEVALTGIGEPTLHPRFLEAVAALRTLLGDQRQITISTNGLLFDDAMAAALVPFHPAVFVSLHRPEKAGPAVEVARRHGLLAGTNASAATSAMDWAGQVQWYNSHPPAACEYLRAGWACVLCNGDITQCCVDADGGGVTGTVWDDPILVPMKPFELCERCSFRVPSVLKEGTT